MQVLIDVSFISSIPGGLYFLDTSMHTDRANKLRP